MIAALRPNDANFDETMSTLRYASSAKLIQVCYRICAQSMNEHSQYRTQSLNALNIH
jgi:hypothetical protein